MRFTRALAVFTVAFAFYIVFTGLLNELTLMSGIIVALAIAIVIEKLNLIKSPVNIWGLRKAIYVFKYLLYFITSEAVEHLRVAKLILSRRLSVNPVVVEMPTGVRSDLALTIIALTITNIPGTIAVDVDKERGLLYVHLLNCRILSIEEVKRRVLGDLEELVKSMVGGES